MSRPIYEINALQHSYAGRPVLAVDQLTIQPASIVGLIGPNGSGKSTFLKLLGLIDTPTRGTIQFNGQAVEPFSDAARFMITMLPQEPFLMKRSVLKNVSYGLRLKGQNKDIADRVDESLALVGLAGSDFLARPWYALSSGESQRVALAARLALKPEVLLLDEPTASVDAASAQLIKEASLKARQKSGTTLIVASHDWQWLYEICDEILHLIRGRIIGTGRETVIFGPWHRVGSEKWGKPLSDNQYLWVPEPPDPDAAAIIDVLPIGEGSITRGEEFVLQGVVSRLSLERKTDRLFATILVGDLPFTMRVNARQNIEATLLPGKAVSIRYRPDRVKWI